MSDLGKFAMKSILDSPESISIEILSITRKEWEDGTVVEDINTSATKGIFDFQEDIYDFLETGPGERYDAAVYIDPSETINEGDKIRRTDQDITFDVDSVSHNLGYLRAELKKEVK